MSKLILVFVLLTGWTVFSGEVHQPNIIRISENDLLSQMRSTDLSVRRNAALLSGSFPQYAEKTVPLLIDLMAEVEIRSEVSNSLVALGSLQLPAIARGLDDKRVSIRIQLAKIIARIGVPAAALSERLCEILKSDTDDSVRAELIRALGATEDGKYAKYIAEQIGSSNGLISASAIEAMHRMGSAGLPGLSVLMEYFNSKDEKLRTASIRLVRNFRSEAKECALILAEALGRGEDKVELLITIANVGSDDDRVVSKAKSVVKGGNLFESVVAAAVVMVLRPDPESRSSFREAMDAFSMSSKTSSSYLLSCMLSDIPGVVQEIEQAGREDEEESLVLMGLAESVSLLQIAKGEVEQLRRQDDRSISNEDLNPKAAQPTQLGAPKGSDEKDEATQGMTTRSSDEKDQEKPQPTQDPLPPSK